MKGIIFTIIRITIVASLIIFLKGYAIWIYAASVFAMSAFGLAPVIGVAMLFSGGVKLLLQDDEWKSNAGMGLIAIFGPVFLPIGFVLSFMFNDINIYSIISEKQHTNHD